MSTETGRPSLRQRQQELIRKRIVDVANELFTTRGFDAVTVAEIAELAEVGRATFFRHFGDKLEVAFAREQQVLDTMVALHRDHGLPDNPALADALAQCRTVMAEICQRLPADPLWRQVERAVRDGHPDLADRGHRKLRRYAEQVSLVLREQGLGAREALLAPELALACFTAGRAVAGDDLDSLGASVDDAFARLAPSIK